jgi:hypothetical protein
MLFGFSIQKPDTRFNMQTALSVFRAPESPEGGSSTGSAMAITVMPKPIEGWQKSRSKTL